MGHVVHKFGGSSLADAKKIQNIANIISGMNETVVVSAIGKTTRMLQQSIDASLKVQAYDTGLKQILSIHLDIIEKLGIQKNHLDAILREDIEQISQMLKTISLTKICAEPLKHFILGFGELWSARVLNAYLNSQSIHSKFIDASDVLYVDDSSFPVSVDWGKSQSLLNASLEHRETKVHIITGFIAQNLEGQRTILGMNCSDYSAAIFAKLLQAKKLIIWTDVAGVYSANPQVVPEARQLQRLSYKEALELAYFGASVVHPLTINPMMEEEIPIYIKSSFDPQNAGTIITHPLKEPSKAKYWIKGLTSTTDVAIMRLQGAGIIGVSGIAAKVFSILEQHGISVMMISQSSSEYSICFAIHSKMANKAVRALEKGFKAEIDKRDIEHIYCDKGYALITAVGDGMRSQPGALSKVIKPLADAKVNIHAITQGSSERSITVTVHESDEALALKLIHAQAKNAPVIELAIGIIGVGNVGKVLIEQMQNQYLSLLEKNLRIRIVCMMNSKRFIQGENLLLDNWHEALQSSEKKANLALMSQSLLNTPVAQKVIIDASANLEVSEHYLEFLDNGIHVVTPNKHANTQSMEYYRELRQVALDNNVSFKYETNVCAGLPLVNTLQTIQLCGDKINKIQGVFSGTLSFIFNQMNQGKTFVDSLMLAYEKGYTEPDPREDLSGMDAARKVVCLAREIGLSIELSDVDVQNLTPKALQDVPLAKFLKEIKHYDQKITDALLAIKQKAKALHFIGEIDAKGKISVGVQACENTSPFAGLSNADNMVLIYSDYYCHSPMVITGAGAGAEVTAAGAFGDVLSLVNRM